MRVYFSRLPARRQLARENAGDKGNLAPPVAFDGRVAEGCGTSREGQDLKAAALHFAVLARSTRDQPADDRCPPAFPLEAA